MKRDLEARDKAAIIIQVRSGQLTATEAARRLGMSRKSYYQWEKRGLEGLMKSLARGTAGRRAKIVDREKAEMQRRISDLEQELAQKEARLRIRELFSSDPGWDKKKA